MAQGDKLVDWGFAENMAYATLIDEGVPIRISGQDCRRGTFFHRHAMLRNQDNGESYLPLQHLHKDQPNFTVIDSVLSEEAVLGYEYGFCHSRPVRIDHLGGAVRRLRQRRPGRHRPVHRLGRRQMGPVLRPGHAAAAWLRRPGPGALIGPPRALHATVRRTQHSGLRTDDTGPDLPPVAKTDGTAVPAPADRHVTEESVASPVGDIDARDAGPTGSSKTVIDEIDPIEPGDVEQVVMCTGKVFFDLLQARRTRELHHVALVRIEQLYPFPRADFESVIARYPNASKFVWCQEEPQNQGAWDQIKHRFHILPQRRDVKLIYAGRPVRRSAGKPVIHKCTRKNKRKLVDDALTGRRDPSMNRRG